jgi:hypothetical protein
MGASFFVGVSSFQVVFDSVFLQSLKVENTEVHFMIKVAFVIKHGAIFYIWGNIEFL